MKPNFSSLLDSILRARLVYEDPIKLWHDNDKSNEYAKVLEDVTKPISLNNGLAYIWTKDDTLFLTFRGTYDINDVWTGLEFYQVRLKDDIFVHDGFHDEFKLLEPIISKFISEFSTLKTIHISAHSLGAGVGQIMAAHYGEKFPDLKIICHTMGCPRTGNLAFVKWFKKNVKENYRIANRYDPVTMVPTSWYCPWLWTNWAHTMDTCIILDKDKYYTSQYDLSYILWFKLDFHQHSLYTYTSGISHFL